MEEIRIGGYRAKANGASWTIYGANQQVIGWIDPAEGGWLAHGKVMHPPELPPPGPKASVDLALDAWLRFGGFLVN